MKTGAIVAISVGVLAVGAIAFFALKKKNPAQQSPYQPVALQPDLTLPSPVQADKKKKNTALIVGAVAGLGALATAILLGKKKDQERTAKGILITSKGIDPKFVL